MGFVAHDLGVDLGTSNTLVYVRHKGIVINEPTIVVVDSTNERRVRAVGDDAKIMLGRTTDGVMAVRPMREGVITDFDMTGILIQFFMRKAIGSSYLLRPRLFLSYPCSISAIERRAVGEAAKYAGARKVFLVEKPFAAALGCGLPVFEPNGCMVVDIGGGTSDIAVISLKGVVESASIKVAGDQFNEAIVKYMRRKHNILIGERTAEQMKMQIGCVFPKDEETTIEIKGRCLMTGLPKTITVTSTEMLEAFEEPVERILEAIHGVLERTPPELVADIANNGIVMTGGGSLVDGFDKLITARTGIHTVVAENAISCVAIGTGKSLDSVHEMNDGTVNLSRRKQMN